MFLEQFFTDNEEGWGRGRAGGGGAGRAGDTRGVTIAGAFSRGASGALKRKTGMAQKRTKGVTSHGQSKEQL